MFFTICYQTELTTHINFNLAGMTVLSQLTLYGHVKTAEQRNTVIGTLTVDGWAVTFGTARMGLGWLRQRPVPSPLYQMQQPAHYIIII